MCGIAGLALETGAPSPDLRIVGALAQALRHRGPDGGGHSVVGRVALVHTRLAVIDIDGGDQPLFARTAALVANGEIYNYRELCQQMPDVCFATYSDCEPALHLWLHEGLDFVRDLRGMYAIAIHERAARTVTLARDPFGIKPLYTAHVSGPHGPGLAFASEPRALLEAGLVERGIRPEARQELLQMQFTTGADTIFPGIRRVLPGESLLVADGKVIERRRQSILPEGGQEDITEDAALARLDRALHESVDLHQRSDVPCGLFLSGGVDSSVLLALMARVNAHPVQAFTAGFTVGRGGANVVDERAHAAQLVRAVGGRHEMVEITEKMVWRHLPEIVAAMDDPTADYAIIPTWFLAREARKSLKVVLSGEGGDEMFAGYGRYRSAMRPWWLGGRVMRGRGTFDRLDVLRDHSPTWRDGLAAAEAAAASGGRTRLAAAQATDCADWLPHDLLLKLDRCLMAHGVEGRTPFLDPAIARAAFRLPDGLKVRGGKGKWLLRKWLEGALPQSQPFAAKKGFSVPIGTWIAGQGERLGKLVAARPAIAELAHPERVVALFRQAGERHKGFAAWTLLFYALWHRTHVEGKWPHPDQDVFDVLAD